MSTVVFVNTFAHSVTFVTDKILLSLKELIRDSGLNPQKLANEWQVLQDGVNTWLRTQDLESLVLEVFDPQTNELVGRWDFELSYGSVGDGDMWVNTEDIKYHILKAGLWPTRCDYRIVAKTKDGRPDVIGWSSTTLRSTNGFSRHGIGTTIDANGAVRAAAAYWRMA
jgi:hypothetical protein